jgi:hypothetical protein
MNIRRTGILTLSLAVLLTFASQTSFATESECGRIYREAHAAFFKKTEALQSMKTNVTYGGALSVTAMVACIWATKSIAGCGALFGSGAAGAAIYRGQITGKLKQLDDARRVYELYYAIQNEKYDAEEVTGLFTDLRVPTHQEIVVVQELTRLVDSGEVCKDGAPSESYDRIVGLLAKKMQER